MSTLPEGCLSVRDLNAAQELLNRLFEEVKAGEGMLSGGTKLGLAGEALLQLKETRISFGNPYHKLTRLTEEIFRAPGSQLDGLQIQNSQHFDFYYMTLPVSMQPGRGVQFTRLECLLDFGPKGENEPIVHSIFPKSEWRELLQSGIDFNLGLDGQLEWSLDRENLENIPTTAGNLPAGLKTKLETKNQFKVFMAVPGYRYELGRTEIAALGEGNSQCFWRIDKPQLKKIQTVSLGIVFKVPKGTSSIELTGIVSVEPDFKWLTANIKDVFDILSDKLKGLLKKNPGELKNEERFPAGDHEKWTIKLPKE